MPQNATITTDQLRTVFLATELGGDTPALNRFSYAQTGESTYSFGLLQFDVGKNGADVQGFLKENGFTEDDIAQLSQHGGLSRKQLGTLDAKLQAIPQDKIEQFTDKQLDQVVARVDKTIDLVREKNPDAADAIVKSPSLQLAIADYDNQFHISDLDRAHPSSNGFVAYLEGRAVPLNGGTIKANDPLSRNDIQQFIDKTKYGMAEHGKDEKHDAAKSRRNRLDQAMDNLGLEPRHANAHQPLMQSGPGAISADGIVKEGVQGSAVHDLQANLAKLGYKDSHGHPISVDGHFGPTTLGAVEAFQLDHHLKADGIAGSKTLHSIHQQTQSSTALGLDNPKNPDHALYQQALDGVHKLDATMGRKSDQQSENLAASLTVAAKAHGMTHIDAVAVSENGSQTFAAQNGAFKQVAEVQTAAAVNTPVAHSAQQLQQMMPKQHDPAQTPVQTPQQATSTLSV